MNAADADTPGSPAHAAVLTTFRDQAVRDVMQWLTYSHLPEVLQRFSSPFYTAAACLLVKIRTDSDELVDALKGLLKAKDHAVRAGIRHDTGRAGSVPRPQAVVDPPLLNSAVSRVTTGYCKAGFAVQLDPDHGDGVYRHADGTACPAPP